MDIKITPNKNLTGMTKRALLFTSGSPFARGVRVVLDELGLDYERQEEITTPSVSDRAAAAPTLQVPTFWDGDQHLWDSVVIVEYLLATYQTRAEGPWPLADSLVRPASVWADRLLMATIQTLGTAATTISQMKWGGTSVSDSGYLKRSADRIPFLLQWLEDELAGKENGFFPGKLAAQDIFLVCHLEFVAHRPIDIECDLTVSPKIQALVERLRARPSFRRNPVRWWEPGVTGYEADGTPIYS